MRGSASTEEIATVGGRGRGRTDVDVVQPHTEASVSAQQRDGGNGNASKGTIRKLVREKGYGFILGEDGKDYFFHHTRVRHARFEDLIDGETVLFSPGEAGDRGERADRVWRDE